MVHAHVHDQNQPGHEPSRLINGPANGSGQEPCNNINNPPRLATNTMPTTYRPTDRMNLPWTTNQIHNHQDQTINLQQTMVIQQTCNVNQIKHFQTQNNSITTSS